MLIKMENDYKTLRMPELKALARESRLTNYSRLRKAELIAFLQDNEQRQQRPPQMSTWEPNRPPQRCTEPTSRMSTWEPNQPPQMSTWEPEREPQQPELEAPLTKRQLKCRRNKDSKLVKKFKNLVAENDNLKSQMEELEDKITKASKSTNVRFKRKKIRSMN